MNPVKKVLIDGIESKNTLVGSLDKSELDLIESLPDLPVIPAISSEGLNFPQLPMLPKIEDILPNLFPTSKDEGLDEGYGEEESKASGKVPSGAYGE